MTPEARNQACTLASLQGTGRCSSQLLFVNFGTTHYAMRFAVIQSRSRHEHAGSVSCDRRKVFTFMRFDVTTIIGTNDALV